jgi:hypothetical protein
MDSRLGLAETQLKSENCPVAAKKLIVRCAGDVFPLSRVAREEALKSAKQALWRRELMLFAGLADKVEAYLSLVDGPVFFPYLCSVASTAAQEPEAIAIERLLTAIKCRS